MGGRWYAWRAALRIARRDAWRNKGRSALIAIMVALPVLAVSAVDVIYRSTELDPQDIATVQLGRDAQARIQFGGGGKVTQAVTGEGYSTDGTSEAPATAQLEARIERLLPAGDELVPDVEYAYGRVVRIGDRSVVSGIREFDYRHRGLEGLFEQLSGREPQTPGEVVADKEFVRQYDVAVGDRLEYRPPRSKTAVPLLVVGTVDGMASSGAQLIGFEGTFAPGAGAGGDAGPGGSVTPATVSWMVVGPEGISWDQVLEFNAAGLVVTSRAVLNDPPPRSRTPYEQEQSTGTSASATAVGVGVVAVGLILLQIALLAGPAIAVGARRNQRGLAIVAAGGGERRHLRSIVLATSGVIGLVGCTAAAAGGVVVGWLSILAIRRWLSDPVPRLDIHLLELAGLVALGTFTAVAASLVPARQAGRMNLVDALTGRRGQAAPRLRVPLTGLLLAVAGAVTAFTGAAAHQPLVTVIGLALGEIGLVVATGALVGLAARLAGRLPLSARFALRDAARQRSRTAPAVAAVMAAIAGSTAALLYVAAQDRFDESQYQASSVLGAVSMTVDPDNSPGPAEIESRLQRSLPVDAVVPLVSPAAAPDSGMDAYVQPLVRPELACPVDTSDGRELTVAERSRMDQDARCTAPFYPGGEDLLAAPGSGTIVDDGSALQALTGVRNPAVTAALKAGRVVVFDPEYLTTAGTVTMSIDTSPLNGGDVATRKVSLPATLVTQRPRVAGVVLPERVLPQLGLDPVVTGYVASTTRMPTGDEEAKAAASVEDVGGYLTVERGYVSDYGIGLMALVVAALVITLGGTFTAVGLAAAEGRADHATLSAVGASPGLRRRLAASQAGVIAGLGAVLGLASGFLAGWALIRLQQPSSTMFTSGGYVVIDAATAAGWQLTLPWLHLVAIGLGVPLLTVLVGFLTTRSRLPLVRRLGQ